MVRKCALLALLCVASVVPVARAQDLYFVRRTGGYGQVGLGYGNLAMTCDSGCAGGTQNGFAANILLGHNFAGGGRSPARFRGEVSFAYQKGTDAASNTSSVGLLTAGLSVYLVGGLYLRGAGTYMNANVDDTTGGYSGKGAGYLVGAGYDLYVGHEWALTPFVHYASSSLSSIDANGGGGLTGTTAGSAHILSFGVNLTHTRGTIWCVNQAGEHIRVSGRSEAGAEACLREVQQRLGHTK